MAEPFIFIGTHQAQAGKPEAFTKHEAGVTEFVDSDGPCVIGLQVHGSENGGVPQLHPDVGSAVSHL